MSTISEMRDKIHGLDLSNASNQKIYADVLYKFILMNEGSEASAYKDTVGKVTVGIGFNMDAPSAKTEWAQAFGNTVSFTDVYAQKRKLVESEIRALFDVNTAIRRKEIQRIYASFWDDLAPNERVTIEDAYFNAPVLVSAKTKFYKHMCDYATNGNADGLQKAIYELQYNSNPTKHKGIQNRRDKQAEMLSSHLCP